MAGRKPKSGAVGRSDFAALLADVKVRIQGAQTRAVLAVNVELVRLYWDIGLIIQDRQKRAGWGAAVIPRLARELHNELPDLKDFSERNIKLMVQLASEYPHAFRAPDSIGQPPVAQLSSDPKGQLPVAQIPWAHNVLLMQKVKGLSARRWYMEQTLANGWSRNILALQIDARAHARHGKAVSNFAAMLPRRSRTSRSKRSKTPTSSISSPSPSHSRNANSKPSSSVIWRSSCSSSARASPSSAGSTASTSATRISTSTCCSTTCGCARSSSST